MTPSFSAGFTSDQPCIESTLFTLKIGWSEVKTVDTRQNVDAIYDQPLMIIILISRTCFERPQLQSCSRLHHVELEMAKFGGSAAGFCINVAFSNQHILSLSGYILIQIYQDISYLARIGVMRHCTPLPPRPEVSFQETLRHSQESDDFFKKIEFFNSKFPIFIVNIQR